MQGASREALAAVSGDVERLLAPASAEQAATMGDELFAVTVLLDEQVGLRRALSDPSVEGDRKVELASAVIGAHVASTTLEVVHGVVRRRWSRMRDLGDALEHVAVLAKLIGADKRSQADEVEDELFRFGRIVENRADLRAALADTNLPATNKTDLVRALLDGKATPTTVALVSQLAAHPRGRTPEAGIAQYGEIAAARRQRYVARVTSAVALTDDESARLRAALANTYGHDIHLHVEIDPDIVGGLVVRVGDEVIDGSVAGRLAQARQRVK